MLAAVSAMEVCDWFTYLHGSVVHFKQLRLYTPDEND